MTFAAARRSARRTFHAPAPLTDVFPLLCPVRERDWIDGWNADVLRSESGFAELGCVFVSTLPDGHRATYVAVRYEPPRAITFVVFHGAFVETLAVDLRPSPRVPGGTELTWTRDFTGLSPEGNAWIEAHVPGAVEERIGLLGEMMTRYLSGR